MRGIYNVSRPTIELRSVYEGRLLMGNLKQRLLLWLNSRYRPRPACTICGLGFQWLNFCYARWITRTPDNYRPNNNREPKTRRVANITRHSPDETLGLLSPANDVITVNIESLEPKTTLRSRCMYHWRFMNLWRFIFTDLYTFSESTFEILMTPRRSFRWINLSKKFMKYNMKL